MLDASVVHDALRVRRTTVSLHCSCGATFRPVNEGFNSVLICLDSLIFFDFLEILRTWFNGLLVLEVREAASYQHAPRGEVRL